MGDRRVAKGPFVQSRETSPVSPMNNLLIIQRSDHETGIWYFCKQKAEIFIGFATLSRVVFRNEVFLSLESVGIVGCCSFGTSSQHVHYSQEDCWMKIKTLFSWSSKISRLRLLPRWFTLVCHKILFMNHWYRMQRVLFSPWALNIFAKKGSERDKIIFIELIHRNVILVYSERC